MPAPSNPAVRLRQRSRTSLRLRLWLAVADGAGLGLVGLGGVLAGSGIAALRPAHWLVFMAVVPIVHVLLTAGLEFVLLGPYLRHHAALLARSDILLWLLEPELPAGFERVAALLGGRMTAAGGPRAAAPTPFERRLQAALLHWEALCAACHSSPYPPALALRLLPIALAALWALAALLGQHAAGLHPLTPPIVFLLTAGAYIGLQRGLGRDSFALSLSAALDRSTMGSKGLPN